MTSTEAMVMPAELTAELTRMRRHPSEFTVKGGAKCKLCYKRVAFDLSHALNPTAGCWCPVHGWLAFDSVKIPPDEAIPTLKQRARMECQKRPEM